jgi:hypothetical protein
MLPNIINVICAIIVVICLILCLLGHYEIIHGIWFMIGLICGCIVFFGTISANIFAQDLRNKYNEMMIKYNSAKDGNISYEETINGQKTTTTVNLPAGIVSSSSVPIDKLHHNTHNTTLNLNGLAQLASMI